MGTLTAFAWTPTDHLASGSLLTVVSIEIVALWGTLFNTEISIDRALHSLGSYLLIVNMGPGILLYFGRIDFSFAGQGNDVCPR